MSEELLKIKDLTISFPTDKGLHTVVDHLNMEVRKGQIVGIVGESGSGKTMTSLAVMGLLDKAAVVDPCSSITLKGKEILNISREERRKIQGNQISMVFQEPMTSLNPVMKVGRQIGEVLRLHTDLDDEEIDRRVADILTQIGLYDVRELMEKYPHQLSGGMRQRVMIAMAIINSPDLIICDEPTTALDVTVQAQILRLLKKINEVTGSSILFISHDLTVIREICQRVVVMYHGQVVESGLTEQIFLHPQKEYTRKLVASMPDTAVRNIRDDVILHLKNLCVYYDVKKGLFTSKTVRKEVIHDMTFDVHAGEIFGIVGESGCGKSTLVKAIVGLNKGCTGEFVLNDERPQMVFQDPYSSLNPAMKIGRIMEEPLLLKGVRDKQERRKQVINMLKETGLDESFMDRYPSELSGGQRQRISIGLALMRGDKFIIADEAVSALDVTIQSQILRLLLKLHDEMDLTYIFISHDLNVVRHMCNRVMVMYLGRMVELAEVEDIYDNPAHPYTRLLFDSILTEQHKKQSAPPTATEMDAMKTGCAFYRRCRFRTPECMQKVPELVNIGTPERPHLIRCIKRVDLQENQ